jgi:HlyD family secretion protein
MPSPASPPARGLKSILRFVIILVVIAGCTWGGSVAWRQIKPGLLGDKRQDKVPTVKVRTATIAEEIVAVGRLRAVFSTELRSEINGRIIKILAVDGQKMEKNEEVLRLDQQDLLTQIQEIERGIEAAKLRAQRARRDHERLMDLQQRGVVTLKDFEDSRITFSLAENDAAIAEARAANLRDKLTKTVIRAPHAGTLLLRDLTEGQVITGAAAQNGGTLLGEVADLTQLMVRTNINEIDVARIKVSDYARVRVDSMRSVQLSGAVKRIATSALESSGDRTRVFPVDVILEQVDERLRPGMSATVMFTLARVDDVIAAPLNTVFSTAESARYVFLRKGGNFVAHGVEIGIADTRNVQIISGLQVGDEVARSRPLEFEGELPVATIQAAPMSRPAKSSNAKSGESKAADKAGKGTSAPTGKPNPAS